MGSHSVLLMCQFHDFETVDLSVFYGEWNFSNYSRECQFAVCSNDFFRGEAIKMIPAESEKNFINKIRWLERFIRNPRWREFSEKNFSFIKFCVNIFAIRQSRSASVWLVLVWFSEKFLKDSKNERGVDVCDVNDVNCKSKYL